MCYLTEKKWAFFFGASLVFSPLWRRLFASVVFSLLCTAVIMKETFIPLFYLDHVITYRTKGSFVIK